MKRLDNTVEPQSPVKSTDRDALLTSMVRLVDDLIFEPIIDTVPEARSVLVSRWEDEENIYFELAIPLETDRKVDLCITQGKAFIRFDR